MDRLERLLNLVHVLQTAREPVPMSTLREQFPDYAEGSHEASRRKIERDKAELARIGLVIEYLPDDEERQGGYVLDVKASYLPELQLSEEDRALLAVAAGAALRDPGFPHRTALRLAVAKLGADPEEEVPVVVTHRVWDRGVETLLETLGDALTRKKTVRIRHLGRSGEVRERQVRPYALFLKRGAWYLCGHDGETASVRVFRVARIESAEVNPTRPGSADFEVPEGFELRNHTRLDPLRFAVHEPVAAAVRVDEEVAFLAERMWGQPEEPGVFRFETTNLDFLIEQVLHLGRRAELLSPEAGRRAIAAALSRVLRAHEEAGVAP